VHLEDTWIRTQNRLITFIHAMPWKSCMSL